MHPHLAPRKLQGGDRLKAAGQEEPRPTQEAVTVILVTEVARAATASKKG